MGHSILIALVLALVAPATASAATQRVAATSVERGSATFRLTGVSSTSIEAARLSSGRSTKRLPLSLVRRAARRGVLRVRTGRVMRAWLLLTIRGSSENKAVTPTPAPEQTAKPSAPPSTPSTPPSDPGTPPSESGTPPPDPPGEHIPAGAKFVSPAGSDSGSGAESQPWRTLGHALSATRPGETVVLRAGTYGAMGTTTQVGLSGTAAAPITLMGHPDDPKPTIQGYVRITGSHLRLSRILFDGPTGRVLPVSSSNPNGEEVQVSVMYGSDVEIRASEIRDNAWHAGIFVADAADVRLVGNYVHDNGDRSQPSQANLDHGIYWGSGSGEVANNLIGDNLAYGVHLYPEAAGVVVRHNTIVGNDRGGVIVAENAAHNRIVNNVVAFNALSGIKAYALSGAGNVAEGNVVWSNGSRNFEGSGMQLSANVEANPRFAAGLDYHLTTGSPAIDRALEGYRVATDYERRSRTGAADVGAYEAG